MGNENTPRTKKIITLLPNEISDFQSLTSLPEEILIKLYNYYRHFSSIQTDDGVIDYFEFCEMIQKGGNMSKKIFNTIDSNKDGVINFREFIKYVSLFITGSYEDKIRISFKLFVDESNTINKENMFNLLFEVITQENPHTREFFTIDEIKNIVNESFNKSLSEEGIQLKSVKKGDRMEDVIDYDAYKKLIQKRPFILRWLKVDLDRIKNMNF